MRALILVALVSCAPIAKAESIDVRLRIIQKNAEDTIITRGNLIKIQQFILQQGKRETYCNMYNNNPAQKTKNYRFYLNPDSGINCDPRKSEFHNLTIRKNDGGKNQYRTIEFLDEHNVYVTSNWPSSDLTVQKIRQFVIDAMKEIMLKINKK